MEIKMSDNKLKLGLSPITKKVYLGRQKKGMWLGSERDVTSDFLQVMEHKFPINTTSNVEVDGLIKFRVIIVDSKKEVAIDGKLVKFDIYD